MSSPLLHTDRLSSLAALCALLLTATSSLPSCEPPAASSETNETRPATAVFDQKRPAWPAELEDVSLGQTLDQWRAALELDPDSRAMLESEDFEDLAYFLDIDTRSNRVDALSIAVRTDENLTSVLTSAWGEPMRQDASGRPRLAWFNPEQRLVAELDLDAAERATRSQWLRLSRYLPTSDIVGAPAGDDSRRGSPFAFEKSDAPLIGLTAEKLARVYADAFVVAADAPLVEGHLELPPTELERAPTWVELRFDSSGTLDSFTLDLDVRPDDARRIGDQLEARFGKAVVGREFDHDVEVYFDPELRRRIRLREQQVNGDPGATPTVDLTLRVERYLPLAELVGGERGPFSFEGEQHWVGRLTEERWRTLKPERHDWLTLPPTECAVSDMTVSPYFEDGTTRYFYFNVKCDLLPDRRDEIVDALSEIYGEPVRGRTDYSRRPMVSFPGTTPPITLEESYGRNGWTVYVGPR